MGADKDEIQPDTKSFPMPEDAQLIHIRFDPENIGSPYGLVVIFNPKLPCNSPGKETRGKLVFHGCKETGFAGKVHPKCWECDGTGHNAQWCIPTKSRDLERKLREYYDFPLFREEGVRGRYRIIRRATVRVSSALDSTQVGWLPVG